MVAYRCFFNVRGKTVSVESIRGLRDFTDGFWVNENLQYNCPACDIKFWIPPSQILFVEKIEQVSLVED